ncbi:RidA family protein [Propionimicrobium lymphophilum]|uniref:RidA family protein n=1 Tax=Propionimicrobium lymphophilum TaxID=33012 RepID=UPI003EC7D1F7
MTNAVSSKLLELGIELPEVIKPLGSYVPAKAFGAQIVTSGQLPISEGKLVEGRLGEDLDVAQGCQAARYAAINALAAAADVAGGVDKIASVDKVLVFVNSAPTFTGQADVANGASDVLGEIFSEAGRHARSAVGVAVLPKNAAVEVELTVTVA